MFICMIIHGWTGVCMDIRKDWGNGRIGAQRWRNHSFIFSSVWVGSAFLCGSWGVCRCMCVKKCSEDTMNVWEMRGRWELIDFESVNHWFLLDFNVIPWVKSYSLQVWYFVLRGFEDITGNWPSISLSKMPILFHFFLRFFKMYDYFEKMILCSLKYICTISFPSRKG